MPESTVQVLLLEDNPGDARLLREMLVDISSGTFIVHHADSVSVALDLLGKTAPYDVVLLDLDLPDSQGFETIDRIQSAAAHIPVVVLTGNDDDAWGALAIEKGVQDYLVKGQIDSRLLRRSIRYATQRKQSETARQLLLDAERAARSEAEKLSRIKDEFLATVSHELKTPLSVILGWTRLAIKGKAPDTKHVLEIIERNASSLSQLIEDLLDMSRIVSGKVRLSLQSVEPEPLVRAIVEGFQIAADTKRIHLEAEFQSNLQTITCDPIRIQQVVSNFLSNALKFTPAGGRIIVRMQQDARELIVQVQDSGKGIAPEFLPHVFDKFLQADAATNRQHGGLGLGLAIAKHTTELHGGSLKAESEGAGKGATFTMTLPSDSLKPPSGRLEAGFTPDNQDGTLPDNLLVLVVDDEEDIRKLVRRVVTEAGARVLTADSAVAAWPILLREQPQVLICDISMPGEDGYSLIRKVRSSTESIGGTSCIALTALARPEDRARALETGFDAHVSKLAEPAELIRTVRRMIPHTSGHMRRMKSHVVQAAHSANLGTSPHILLAEDHALIAEMISICLELEGYRVSVANSVKQAVSVACKDRVDLILSDLRLNDGTGWELMQKIREHHVIPGIMMSGYSDSVTIAKSKDMGFAEYLVKPVDQDVLCERIAEILKSKKPAS